MWGVSMHEQLLLQAYWQVLTRDADFQQAWQGLCEAVQAQPDAMQERIEAFCMQWKVPPALAEGIRWKLRLGEFELRTMRYVLQSEPVVTLPPPPCGLPPADPTRETLQHYLKRVQQHLDMERFLRSPDLPTQLQQAGLNPAPETLQMLQEQHRTWEQFTAHHPAPEYAEDEDVIRIATRYFRKCVEVVEAQGAVVLASKNRQHNPEYIRRVALQVYLRVVKGWTWGQIAEWLKNEREKKNQPALNRQTVLETTRTALQTLRIAPLND